MQITEGNPTVKFITCVVRLSEKTNAGNNRLFLLPTRKGGHFAE